ncbi:MAG: hypothetical protein HOQ05_12675 [Corynebacteriales bacterium]|nr:hypothetical protein [Mycobacteriales bacterium]
MLRRLIANVYGRHLRVRRATERGDVPGWVMITVMTAGLVTLIFGVFSDKITDAISSAIDQVTSDTSGS